jgi:hypothetical protein
MCSRTSRSGLPGLSLGQIVSQDYGAVVQNVTGAVEQRHCALSAGIENRRPGIGLFVQLFLVPSPELVPTLHAMAEPPA